MCISLKRSTSHLSEIPGNPDLTNEVMPCGPHPLKFVESRERIVDGLNLGAKERDLEPIGCKNMKIERQKYVSHKSEASHGPC
ncbi:hypothetical protein MTR_8g467130 [Medicago truncatula]|uniref:Uncharacterized protein n=1 Tax=Medicago truncatula TaxID=3880 RepID=A0A072TS69_MEDTR|nr:hypothetical protein MTR_8g467130 [Medicago truncatula]